MSKSYSGVPGKERALEHNEKVVLSGGEKGFVFGMESNDKSGVRMYLVELPEGKRRWVTPDMLSPEVANAS